MAEEFKTRFDEWAASDPTLKGLEAALNEFKTVSSNATAALYAASRKEQSLFEDHAPRSIPTPITNVSSWTVDALKEHFTALRESDMRLEAERDRRYAEVKAEQEKALKIKEEADKAALLLASKIQEYKDEKANELRSQIEREQGERVSKAELQAAVERIQAESHSNRLDGRTLLFGLLNILLGIGLILAATGTLR